MSPTRSMMSLSFTLIWLNVLSARQICFGAIWSVMATQTTALAAPVIPDLIPLFHIQLLSWWIGLELVPKYKKILMSISNSKMGCKPVQIGQWELKCLSLSHTNTNINSKERVRAAREHCWWRWLKSGANYHSNDDYSSLGVIKARGGCVGWLNADETPQRERARARALFCVWHKDTANIFTRHNNGCKQGVFCIIFCLELQLMWWINLPL